MPNLLESTVPSQQQSTLQKILTSAVNEVGMEAVLVAIITHEGVLWFSKFRVDFLLGKFGRFFALCHWMI